MKKYDDFKETENVTINPTSIEEIYGDFRETKNVTVNTDRDIVNYFENNPKRYKIRQKRAFEQEIDEERKRVTINTFAVGATILATTVCTILTTNPNFDTFQRIGSVLMGVISTKGICDSAKILNESIKRKLKLERTYFDTYNEEYQEQRGRSL